MQFSRWMNSVSTDEESGFVEAAWTLPRPIQAVLDETRLEDHGWDTKHELHKRRA